MKVRIASVASAEVEEAVAYYNSRLGGLGFHFANEFEATVDRILAHPRAWTRFSTSTRKCNLRRFP